jgi:hypothetical protein
MGLRSCGSPSIAEWPLLPRWTILMVKRRLPP